MRPSAHRTISLMVILIACMAETQAVPMPAAPSGQESGPGTATITADDWREDLELMTGLLLKLQARDLGVVGSQAFEQEAERIATALPDRGQHEILVSFARLVASIGDGHTRVNLAAGAPGVPEGEDNGFVSLPLRLQWFAEGLFVRSATEELAPLVGGRVLELGDLPIDEAIERIRPVVHRDNEMTLRLLLPRYAALPAVLHAVGAIDDLGSVRLVVEVDGRRIERRIAPLVGADDGLVDVATAPGVEIPWWLRSRGRPYWFDRVPQEPAIYVQLNASRPYDEETLPEFVERLRTVLESEPVERVILDLRRNDGGDSALTRPLMSMLAGWRAAQPGRGLFTLIGRATFSAAVVLATEMDRYADTILVGEPTGGRPNQYGEIESFTLPHSGLSVSYASWYFQTSDPWDARAWLPPDVAVDPRFEDFARGHDAALAAALRHDLRAPLLEEQLLSSLNDGGVDAVLETYRAWRAAPEHRYAYAEPALTPVVIALWRNDQIEASLPVAELAFAEYPESHEAAENVAEIHAALGNRDAAIRYALASLRLNPRNGDALEVLRDVCGAAIVSLYLVEEPLAERGEQALQQACGAQQVPMP